MSGEIAMNTLSIKCPRCTASDLVVSERNAIEIDVCPSCRGVWLDRGELDKLIERSLQWRSSSRHDDDDDDDRHERHGRRDRDDDHWKHRRKQSWLSELFD